MDSSTFVIQNVWIHIASFCTLRCLGKLRATCNFLNELLSSNTVWKVKWNDLCFKYGLDQQTFRHLDSVSQVHLPVPHMYENLCFRMVSSHRERDYALQWFVMNSAEDIESFDIAQNLRCFSFFDSSRLRWKMERSQANRMRSAFSSVVAVRRGSEHVASFLDALIDLTLTREGRGGDTYFELWPFGGNDRSMLINHRIPMLMRKKRNLNENCLSQHPGLTCGMSPAFCSVNFLGSGWKLRRRRAAKIPSERHNSLRFVTSNYELYCRICELLKPGVIVQMETSNLIFRSPFHLDPKDMENLLFLFFHVIGYKQVSMFNLALHVSTQAQTETCLIIESYSHHTVVTPIVDGVVLSGVVRCKGVGFSRVLDYLVHSLNMQRALFEKPQVSTSSLIMTTDPERLTLSRLPGRDLRAAHRRSRKGGEGLSECTKSKPRLGFTHHGTAIHLKDSILGVFKGANSCDKSELMMLLATEYMYKCLDLIAMVMDILGQFDLAVVRQLVGHIFLVGENTRITGFQARVQEDLGVALDRLATILDGHRAVDSVWPIHIVHADVNNNALQEAAENEIAVANTSVLGRVDYILHGPNLL